MKSRLNEGMAYIMFGLFFLLITIDLLFPFIMFIMKGIFYIIGGLSIIGGTINMIDSLKNKNNNEA